MSKLSVLFVCTHNSARSQMAEGLLRKRYGTHYEAYSAGTERTRVHPMAERAMAEQGIDLSGHHSKTVGDLEKQAFDYVVTVCDSARERCPYVPAHRENIHQSFRDPSAAEGTAEERQVVFREVRGELAEWIDQTFAPKTASHEEVSTEDAPNEDAPNEEGSNEKASNT